MPFRVDIRRRESTGKHTLTPALDRDELSASSSVRLTLGEATVVPTGLKAGWPQNQFGRNNEEKTEIVN